MTILRYTASIDNTITNAFDTDFLNRATGSNMGASDVLEVFSIYGNYSTSSVELSRILIQFPIQKIIDQRDSGILPDSGSVKFVLKLYNCPHYETVPNNFEIQVSAISSSWEEGNGLDMEDYKDILSSNSRGSNWLTSSKGQTWSRAGGDYHNSPVFTQTFKTGLEDLNVDVSELVEQWIKGEQNDYDNGKKNYGFGIRLSNAYEGYFSGSTIEEMSGNVNIHNITGSTESYYTKKFFARKTQFFFKQPILEAQFNNRITDDRNNLFLSSSLLAGSDNINNLYFYNYYKGKLRDIANNSSALPAIQFYYSSGSKPEGEPRSFLNSSNSVVNYLTASRVSRGIYKASFCITSSITNATYPYLVDVWTYLGEQILTGSIMEPKKYRPDFYQEKKSYVLSMPNLKKEYSSKDNVKLRLYAREKNWSPNVYTVAKNVPQNLTLVSSSYRLIRVIDQLEVIPHGYGEPMYSLLSYDVSGNYFNFDMSMLEPGYQYGFKFSIFDDYVNSFEEQPYIFKFRVI